MLRNLSWRLWRVWARNLMVYMRTWKVNFIPPLAEPALYILAFGAGLGGIVGSINVDGRDVGYTAYIAPGLVAASVMWQSFYENTYASFVRMYYQKTFDAMLATPLSLEDVITAEIFWGATKAVVGTLLMGAVIAAFGYIPWPQGLWLIPLSALGGLAFGAVAMWMTGITPTIDMFNLPIFLFITPMFLFSGAFFPVDGLPAWASGLAQTLPLYHLTQACRSVCLGEIGVGVLYNALYLAAFTVVFYPLAVGAMRKRLIK
ncbi:MAG: ABC transporter permease [Desulfovibrio sp.]|nr:ABC transporter permease [Desulfovibrio sp.]